jgi:hypothetical protein
MQKGAVATVVLCPNMQAVYWEYMHGQFTIG